MKTKNKKNKKKRNRGHHQVEYIYILNGHIHNGHAIIYPKEKNQKPKPKTDRRFVLLFFSSYPVVCVCVLELEFFINIMNLYYKNVG